MDADVTQDADAAKSSGAKLHIEVSSRNHSGMFGTSRYYAGGQADGLSFCDMKGEQYD